jgi:hypothetical protein
MAIEAPHPFAALERTTTGSGPGMCPISAEIGQKNGSIDA